MNEFNFIQNVSSLRKQNAHQLNKTWESDAEIVQLKDCFLAVLTDSFSETEDFFRNTPPETIGRNIAWGTLADLCACGVSPQFIVQSWNCDSAHTDEYYTQIARGIEATLTSMGTSSLGGDSGCAAPWLWTGTTF